MQIQENVSLRAYTTIALDLTAAYMVTVKDVDEVKAAIKFARTRDIPLQVLGGGSNVIFLKDYPGLIVIPMFEGFAVQGTAVRVGAGESWHQTVLKSLKNNLYGLENLSLIPGLVGAAPIQNIGAYGQELDRVFLELEAIDLESGDVRTFSREECEFGYRQSIFKAQLLGRYLITSVTLVLADTFDPILDYKDVAETFKDVRPTASAVSDAIIAIRQRKLPDPLREPNVGSFFKNPIVSPQQLDNLRVDYPLIPSSTFGEECKVSAAWLIEQAGLKGYCQGDAQISNQHSLVVVNRGNASIQEILALKSIVEKEVNSQFGILLEAEPSLI